MSHAARVHQQAGFARRKALPIVVFVLVFVLALVAGLNAQGPAPGSQQPAIDLKTAKAGTAKPLSLPPAPAGLPRSVPAALRASARALMSPGAGTPVAGDKTAASYYFVIRAEFDSVNSRQNLKVPGVTLLTAFDRFAEVFVPLNAAQTGIDPQVTQAFISAPGLVWIDYPEAIQVPPVPTLQSTTPTRAVAEQIVRGGTANLTGKGVIVAVIDSGLDFRNRDFITFDAAGHPTSRLLYLWDTMSTSFDSSGLGGKAPYSFPNGRSIGTLYTRQQLTAELAAGSKRIPATDEHGHGTAAAGIAAGSGNNSKAFVGVAPDADIIAVRIGGSTGSLENGYLLNAAVAWVDSIAKQEGKPVVFSCSFGGHGGGHNGDSIEERELQARFANAPGRAIVIAAGNERIAGLHTQVAVAINQPANLAWKSDNPAMVDFYVHSPSGAVPDPKQLAMAPLVLTGTGQLPTPTLNRAYQNPISQDLVLEFTTPANWAGMVLSSTSQEKLQVDGYILGGAFDQSIQRQAEIVGTPGSSGGAITVGSYDWNDQFSYQGQMYTLKDACGNAPMQLGSLSCYSSIGYDRGGSIKPDITAPGQWYSSSYARNPDGSGVGADHNLVDSSGNYMLFNGTSAATPYVAGIVALMLQKKPTLTSGDIKSLLQHNSTQDFYTGNAPNASWGYGKLDLAAVRATLNAIR